jgi:hypothetical protein
MPPRAQIDPGVNGDAIAKFRTIVREIEVPAATAGLHFRRFRQ